VYSLSGDDWFIHEDVEGEGVTGKFCTINTGDKDWIPAKVPGNIQADLEAAHVLNPLWYGTGDSRLFDVCLKDWWYRKDFFVPDKWKTRRIKLIFEGVDYECEVWLNGKLLGVHEGMFHKFWFDLNNLLKYGQKNKLALKIARMPKELFPFLKGSDSGMSGHGTPFYFVNGIHKARQILKGLKSPTNFSYDWGTNIWTLGIWKDISLEATGPARIDWVQVQTKLTNQNRNAIITIRLEIDSLNDLKVKAKFNIKGHNSNAAITVDANLKKGENIVKASLLLNNPVLWWPNGQGKQTLYKVESKLEMTDTGALIDAKTTQFGVREIRWEQVEGAPKNFINPFRLVVNGRSIRMMGSNLVPPDLLFGRINRRGSRLFYLAKAAGINTFRLWGGGVILPREIYELADELGIMLSLEFPMANCSPESESVFLENLEETVRNIVKQVRNHPSIIEWSGGNEMHWKQGDDHPALHVLERVTSEEDNRIFRATCPIQGSTHSPWNFQLEGGNALTGTRDANHDHYKWFNTIEKYQLWVDKARTIKKEYQVMRYGEFGCQTPANLEVWHREIPPSSQWPIEGVEDPIRIRKNVVQAVFGKEFWLLKRVIEDLFGPAKDLKSLIEMGQFIGAEGLRYALDALRRKGNTIGGFTSWDYNEPWPNGAGSYLIDYDGRPLMNYDFVKQALAPISLNLRYDSILYEPSVGVEAELFLVSDAPTSYSGLCWSWIARNKLGQVINSGNGKASIHPQQVLNLGQIKVKPPEQTVLGPVLIELRLNREDGCVLVERIHAFGARKVQAPLAGLLNNNPSENIDTCAGSITRTSLSLSSSKIYIRDNQEILKIELKNTGKMTALFCELHPLIEYRTDTFITNNHLFIPPSESRVIKIVAPSEPKGGLTLDQTGWRISCWNADDIIIPPNDEVLFSIGRRDAMCREYLGYDSITKIDESFVVKQEGNRGDTSKLPLLLGRDSSTSFVFKLDDNHVIKPARLRIHTADQDNTNATAVEVTVNDRIFKKKLPKGLGIQDSDPSHLAFPATLEFDLPKGTLKSGRNVLRIQVNNCGWFTWDALDLVAISQ
jgi:beta-mannosidase